jgi:RNA polymerase sigma factor (sigma-70 family)
MAAALEGNGNAYNRLLSEVAPWLFRYFARRLPNGIAEDAVQETLMVVHNKRHTYQPERPFQPWLAGIARYKYLDRLRSMGRHPTVFLEDEVYEPALEGHEGQVTSAIVLDRLLTKLKPAQRAVIRLVRIEGYSVEEAAVMTGQSQALVKVNIHRGLAKLAAVA